MKRTVTRKTIRLVSFTLAACIIFGGTAFSGYQLAGFYRTNLENTYQRALNDLSTYVNNLETTLTKGLYANTAPQQYGITQKLTRDSDGAKAALGQLPLSDVEMDGVNKFISQVGDYASYLSQRLSKGNKITPEEMDSLQKLGEYAKTLNSDIKDMQARFEDGKMNIGQAEVVYTNIAKETEDTKEPFVSTGFREMNEGFVDYPSLVYDGPFSDHLLRQEPKMLKDAPEITAEEAYAKAATFSGLSESQLGLSTETGGNLPVYNFLGENIELSVTKNGGYVNSMLNSRVIADPKMEFSQAAEIAVAFLRDKNINEMRESYYVIADGICTINYAFESEGIIYYSDLIKVSVALDNGEIVGFNATGYLMNHVAREPAAPGVSPEQAQEAVSPRLNIIQQKLACIPTASKEEVLCYEFTCNSDSGQNVLVYINADSGLEEQIFILLQSDNGILVM